MFHDRSKILMHDYPRKQFHDRATLLNDRKVVRGQSKKPKNGRYMPMDKSRNIYEGLENQALKAKLLDLERIIEIITWVKGF